MHCRNCNKELPPFKRQDGSIVPFAWLECDCQKSTGGKYGGNADFDFPCSDTFRGLYFEQAGRADPGHVPMTTSEPSKSTPLPVQTIPDKRADKLEGNLISLRDILKEHVNQPKGKKRKDNL